MSVLSGSQLIIPNAVALSGAPQVSSDTIDKAVANLSSYVWSYARAKRFATPNSGPLVGRDGNSINVANTEQTITTSDASFGGMTSINVSACAGAPYEVPGRSGSAPPASFTFLAALCLLTANPSGKFPSLVTLDVSNTYGLTLKSQTPVSGLAFTYEYGYASVALGAGSAPSALNTPCIWVFSFDNTTKIVRAGLNGLPTISGTATLNLSPATTDKFRIFGDFSDTTSGNNLLCKWETFAIFNQAAGAGYAIDSLLSTLIGSPSIPSSMRGVYGF